MTTEQFRAALASLNLTQAEAAKLLGVCLRTAAGYATGKPIPDGYAKLLRLMLRFKLRPRDMK
jgi:transcriptional regulator with XRE-family HTH domain